MTYRTVKLVIDWEARTTDHITLDLPDELVSEQEISEWIDEHIEYSDPPPIWEWDAEIQYADATVKGRLPNENDPTPGQLDIHGGEVPPEGVSWVALVEEKVIVRW